eukprot:COSAG02_NODE_1330_length_13218_cov_8.247504_4_plen_50_part_00
MPHSARGEKKFEPSSLAPGSEPLLGPHLEDYWSIALRQLLTLEVVTKRG